MGKSCQSAQSDCGRDYSQGIDLCLNEGDEVVDCDLIIICEHEIAVGIMGKKLLRKSVKGWNRNMVRDLIKHQFQE